MRNRVVGLLISGISLFIAFLVWLFNKSLNDIVGASCSHGPTCPMWGSIKLQTNIGIAVLVFVLLIGLYLIFFAKDIPLVKEVHKIRVVKDNSKNNLNQDKESKELHNVAHKKTLSSLSDDERKIYSLILDANGSVFQSELVKKTGYSKVRVTRILDRLEGKGLIERKRRGMTNIIILRH
jgi:hypothetical protein